jgi:hypothetical protein
MVTKKSTKAWANFLLGVLGALGGSSFIKPQHPDRYLWLQV